jgi:glycosyltransferase involved in cell wall biosynthesis
MRVLRIAHASLTPRLRDRERALARCYPDVQMEVVTTDRWREAEVDVEAAPDDLFPVTKARALFSKHVQLFAYDPRPLIAAMRRHRPHLIDLNAEPYSVACAEVLTLRNLFSPRSAVVLQNCQNILRNYPKPFNWLERRALKQIAAALPCSETVVEVLMAKGFRKPMPVVPFGVNLEEFTFRPASSEIRKPLTIGFVGRMLPGKGLNVLAQALAKLQTEDWSLLVVGDGPERKPFTVALAEAGLLRRAKFTGAIKYDDVPALFHEIDILVVPTETTQRIREQFGRVIVEAMACGIPVIGSTCGAIPEVIDDAGVVFPEGDADALTRALRQMLDDANLRAEFALAGRRRVEQNYTWDRVAQKTYELYRRVVLKQPSEAFDPGLEFAS